MSTDNYTRVAAIESGLTAPQRAKLDIVRHNMALGLARKYGDRLAQIMCDKLVAEVVLRPEVIAELEGVDATLAGVPNSVSGWAEWATDAVAACALSQRSIAASDNELKVQLEHEAMAAVPPTRRRSMPREGTWDAHIASRVAAALEERIIGGRSFA